MCLRFKSSQMTPLVTPGREPLFKAKGCQFLSGRGHAVDVFRFLRAPVSVVTGRLCPCSAGAAPTRAGPRSDRIVLMELALWVMG